MTLSLTIGSGPIALVQSGAVAIGPADTASATLTAPSTPGTALIAVLADLATAAQAITTAPTGFVRLSQILGTTTSMEVWIYANNPGGLQTLSFKSPYTDGGWFAHVSEWSNVFSVGTLEASGTGTSASGSTLSLSTTTNVINPGDLAIAVWLQNHGSLGACSFTSPAGFTRLADNGSAGFTSGHLDAEYQIGPSVAQLLNVQLASSVTQTSATGAVLVLKQGTPALDQTAYLAHDSQSIKLNTYDFGLMLGGKYLLEDGSGYYLLEDGSGVLLLDTYTPQLGDPVALANPAWSGRVVSVTNQDLTDKLTNYRRVSVTAINSAAAPGGSAPGDLSDVPAGGYFTLEDGSGKYLLEDGSGYYEQEGTSYAYRHLSVRTSQNQDGTTTIYGSLETFETGFAPGQTFLLTSANLGYAAQSFTITNVTTMFIGANPPTPVYLIEFGDAYQTLQLAGGGVLTKQGSQANIQAGVAMPAGTLGYVAASATQTGITTEVDLTSLTTTVQTVAGRRLKITGLLPQVDTSVAATWAGLRIYEDGNVIQDAKLELVATTDEYEMIAMAIRQPTAGAHTYKLTLRVTTGTGTLRVLWFATGPPFVLVEDIGT